LLSATINPDIKRTLEAISKRTGMTVSQVTDEVLNKELIEIHELDAPG
jgi:antitoxin component of RelBE/YafQ-DinJ toxin-antitoxin module|tara:strand:+ start:848 stop:991 length:144 start_codon:yes stop_codon:yes gene_type:complete